MFEIFVLSLTSQTRTNTIKMETLELKISELKNGRTLTQLKNEDKKTFYKVQNLSSQLSYLKAEKKGNFVTKEHLTEFKGLIIFLIKKANFRGYADLKETMSAILKHVENDKVVFLTEKGIKGIVSQMALNFGIENSRKNLIEKNGIDICRENTLNNRLLSDFQSFKLDVLM